MRRNKNLFEIISIRNKDLTETIKDVQTKLEEKESEVGSNPEEVQKLKDIVNDQKNQIQNMESRYQMYLEKCRNVSNASFFRFSFKFFF